MLTGDKIETATTIAISTGLKSKTHDFYIIQRVGMINDLQIKLQNLALKDIQKTTLMIDGYTLETILSDKTVQDQFFNVAI
jgi:magnesium-transporting ATPase (P-type)